MECGWILLQILVRRALSMVGIQSALRLSQLSQHKPRSQHKPSLDTHHIPRAETQYRELKRVLLEIGVEAMARDALARELPKLIPFGLMILMDMAPRTLDFHVRSASPMSVVRLERMSLFRPATRFVRRFISRRCVFLYPPVSSERSRYA